MKLMTNPMIRIFLYGTLPAACLLLHMASCFHFHHAPVSMLKITPTINHIDSTTSSSKRYSIMSFPFARSSLPARNDDDDDENPDNKSTNSADGLYEFLTRRTGEQAGEVERRRKRDRILGWMTSSSNKKGNAGSNMVKPIRLEDETVLDDDDDDEGTAGSPLSTTPKLEKMFSGMPTLDEILSRKEGEGDLSQPTIGVTTTPSPPTSTKQDDSSSSSPALNMDNDAWFEEERQQLIQEYEQILQDTKSQLAEQRKQDPDTVPENSERIIESVVFQERNRMISAVKVERAKERLQQYEIDRMSNLDSSSLKSNVDSDEIAKKILQEAADDWNRRQELQSKYDEFERYQQDAFLKQSSSINEPKPGENADQWALERLEGMLENANKAQSDDVLDILEINIDELRENIEKESKKGSIKPETMKEWQMYRSIATRLNGGGVGGATASGDDVPVEENVDEEQILNQLNSWKEYIGKEKEIRNRSGLSVGPKMPFDWNKPGKDPREDPIPTPPPGMDAAATQGKTRREIRRDVNIQAVKAMEELISKSDSKRSENLQIQLDALKAELESRDYNDIEEEGMILEENKPEPVDLSEVFSRGREEEEEEDGGSDKEILPSGFTEYEKYGIDRMLSKSSMESGDTSSSYTYSASPQPPISQQQQQQPPVQESYYDDSDDDTPPADKPNTPFFADDGIDEKKVQSEEVDVVNTKLGSGEEQKLRAMYRRAGAVTKEQQDAIRKEWEAFQSFEKARRDESGLSDGWDESSLMENADLKYDLSDVMKSDGDIDAEKILASLGPRPKRKKSSGGSSPSSSSDAIDPAVVADSLYRSVEAVGGGTTKDDPVARKRERSEFEEYLQKEQEVRKSLDDAEEETVSADSSAPLPLDDPDYVEDVLDSIGPRPMFKRKVKELPPTFKRRQNAEESSDDSRTDDTDSVNTDDEADLVPNWLKKERKAAKSKMDDDIGLLGGNMNDVFDDDKYEQNIRQLHEYEQRRSGRNKQMGIDISDVLGRRGSDDYADYTYDADYFRGRQGGWGASSFEARKLSLLDYTELTTAELNNLLDHRDSVYTTGASQYLPRINKPFKEFGAIFRLEGVLVDLTGLHSEVWTEVASKHKFNAPMLEDIRKAAVTRPELAIRDIFYWTNDIQLANKILSSFREIFRHKFDQWASDNGIVAEKPKEVESQGSMALGAEVISRVPADDTPSTTAVPLTEESRLTQIKERWSAVAESRGYSAPTNEQIAQCSFLPPGIAVRNVLGWSNDPVEIDSIVTQLEAPSNSQSNNIQNAPMAAREERKLDQGAVLELQYKAWTRVANDNGLDAPEPEEVLAASVLNDPEAVVKDGYGWTDETDRARTLAKQYRDYFESSMKDFQQPDFSDTVPKPSPVEIPDVDPKTSNGATRNGPSEEEVLKMQIEAWEKAANVHMFSPPPPDEIQLAINLSADDAVRRLLGWKYNFNGDKINDISSTYEEALMEASKQYLNMYNIPVETAKQPVTAIRDESNYVTADMLYQAALDAWTNVAWKSGKPLPDQDQVQFAMTVGPEEAIVNGFEWADDYTEAAAIAEQYRGQLKGKREAWKKKGYVTSLEVDIKNEEKDDMPLVSIKSGVEDWIRSLQEVEMGCGVASYLERDQMDVLIKFANLADLFPADKCVSLNNGYDRESQQMLGVALRIERRPDHCVIFDSSPCANSAAQEVDMRSVSLVGPYPRYELLSADTSAFSLDELTALNIRRLFGERVYDQPMLDMKQSEPEIVRKTMTKFWDPED